MRQLETLDTFMVRHHFCSSDIDTRFFASVDFLLVERIGRALRNGVREPLEK
jgi:hypothetical protein